MKLTKFKDKTLSGEDTLRWVWTLVCTSRT